MLEEWPKYLKAFDKRFIKYNYDSILRIMYYKLMPEYNNTTTRVTIVTLDKKVHNKSYVCIHYDSEKKLDIRFKFNSFTEFKKKLEMKSYEVTNVENINKVKYV